MKMMQKPIQLAQKGFTLIELMIVVAIIGILAAVAIPAYQDYISKAQVTEGVNLLGGLKVDIANYYGEKGEFPDMTKLIAFAGVKVTSGKYVSTITSTVISDRVTFLAKFRNTGVGANIKNKFVEIVYTTASGGKFVCQASSSNGVPAKYLPAACKP